MEERYGLYTCNQFTWPIHRHFGFHLATKRKHILQHQQHHQTLRRLDSSLCNADRYAVQAILHMARHFYQQGTAVGLLRCDPGSLNPDTRFSDMMVNFWQLVESRDNVFNRHTTVVSLAPVRSGSGRYIVELHDESTGRLSHIRVKNATHAAHKLLPYVASMTLSHLWGPRFVCEIIDFIHASKADNALSVSLLIKEHMRSLDADNLSDVLQPLPVVGTYINPILESIIHWTRKQLTKWIQSSTILER